MNDSERSRLPKAIVERIREATAKAQEALEKSTDGLDLNGVVTDFIDGEEDTSTVRHVEEFRRRMETRVERAKRDSALPFPRTRGATGA